VAAVTNAFGRSLQFVYDDYGRLVSAVPPDAQRVGYAYDGAGRLAVATHADGSSRTYHYEDTRWPSAMTGITDEAGVRYAIFTYDSSGRAINTNHAGAQSYSVSYPSATTDTVGRLVAGSTVDPAVYRVTAQIADPLGTPQSYVWQGGDGQVRLLGASGAYDAGQLASRTLGDMSLPVSETDFLGVQTLFTWDLTRQLKTATTRAVGLPEAQSSATEWHPGFRLPVRITESGRATAFTYDERGNKLSETVTDLATGHARTWQWTYNAQGLAETMTDPKGAIWRYGYDAVGNLTSEKNPLGQPTTYSHDAAGRVLTRTEPDGLVTRYAYDTRGRLVTQSRGGEVSTFTYAPTGLLAGAALPNGLRVSYSYDAAQRLIAAADNRGNSITYSLDSMGNRVREEVRDANGNIALATARAINALNKVAAIQGAQGQSTHLAYDANGEPVSTTDALNQTTRQSLDGLRRPTATTFPDNTSASQAWNPLDQLTRVTDPKGVATSSHTNAIGEVMS
jgi:YD repeat-containing protein